MSKKGTRLRAHVNRALEAWSEVALQLPPRPAELAWAIMLGGVAIALSNAMAIILTVPSPGIRLRLLHVLFDSTETLGLAACFAAPFAAWGLVERGRRRWRSDVALWIGLAVCCTAAMHHMLGMHLTRQAHAVLDGRAAAVLLPLYTVLCGLAIPAALLVGASLSRLGKAAAGFAALVSLGGIVTAHAILRDDYPSVHFAILWTSLCLIGATAAPTLSVSFRRAGGRGVAVVSVLCALSCFAVTPPNRVRLQLFREPGAVAAWLLARHVWGLPVVPESSPSISPPLMPAKCTGGCRVSLPAEPVVVLITIDAVRGDLLQERELDKNWPTLAKLRDRGAYFSRAVAPGSQTSVSLSAMFASRYFSQQRWAPFGAGSRRFLYPALDSSPRFPQILTDAGVHTGAVLSLFFLGDRFGVARGFAHEEVVVRAREYASAAQVVTPLIRRLRAIKSRQRAFLYAHMMEPHEPYNRGKLKEGSAYDRYLSEVQEADRWVRSLWRHVRRRFPRRGYLVITSDHGEAFGEHGTHFHTKTLYEELLRVPLVVWGPGVVPGTREARVSLVDVGPTLLDLFGVAIPSWMMGTSLLPNLRGAPVTRRRPIMAEGRLRRVLYASGDLKVIEDGVRKTVEVYDLRRDPGETNNLFDLDRARVAAAVTELRKRHDAIRVRDGDYEPPYKP